jgi:peptidoglycan/LPS O-acetylase OafA/YrhL
MNVRQKLPAYIIICIIVLLLVIITQVKTIIPNIGKMSNWRLANEILDMLLLFFLILFLAVNKKLGVVLYCLAFLSFLFVQFVVFEKPDERTCMKVIGLSITMVCIIFALHRSKVHAGARHQKQKIDRANRNTIR